VISLALRFRMSTRLYSRHAVLLRQVARSAARELFIAGFRDGNSLLAEVERGRSHAFGYDSGGRSADHHVATVLRAMTAALACRCQMLARSDSRAPSCGVAAAPAPPV
jgi:hypothetical protein